MSRPVYLRSWLSASLALIMLSACSPPRTDVAHTTVPPASTLTDTPTSLATPTPLPGTQIKPVPKVDSASPPLIVPPIQVGETGLRANQPALRPYTQAPQGTKADRPAKATGSVTQAPAQETTASSPQAPTFKATQRMVGFSPNGTHFMYLESSRDTGAGIPRSTMQVMDLARNTCVENGCVKTNFGEQDANRSTTEAESELLQQTAALRQNLNMAALQSGTVLPIQSRSRTPDGTEVVTLQVNNRPLQIQLRQTTVKSPLRGGTAEADRSAMQLEVTYNGQKRTLDSLSNYRDWVFDYSIREVRVSPDGRTIAILLTATQPTFEGTLATTLVQGMTL